MNTIDQTIDDCDRLLRNLKDAHDLAIKRIVDSYMHCHEKFHEADVDSAEFQLWKDRMRVMERMMDETTLRAVLRALHPDN